MSAARLAGKNVAARPTAAISSATSANVIGSTLEDARPRIRDHADDLHLRAQRGVGAGRWRIGKAEAPADGIRRPEIAARQALADHGDGRVSGRSNSANVRP
jgi:hypothetical protein